MNTTDLDKIYNNTQLSGNLVLPNTNIAATATSTLNLGSASSNNTLGTMTVAGGATLTVQDAASLTVSSLSATNETAGAASIGGVPIANSGVTMAAANTSLTLASTVTLTAASMVTVGAVDSSGTGTVFFNGTVNVPNATTVNVVGGGIGGTGTVNSTVTVAPAAKLDLKDNATTGQFTIAVADNDLSLGGNSEFEINASDNSSDKVVVADQITYAGTLTITNLAGTPALNQSWDLFDGTRAGASTFSSISPAGPGPGLAWSFDYATGVLSVVGGIAAPTVTSITPQIGPTTGGTLVTIYGSNFVSITSVTFGGTAATITGGVGTTQLNVTTAAHGAGLVEVVVSNSGGSGSLAGSSDFSYATSTVDSVVVNGGPGVVFGASTFSLAGQHSVVKQILVTFHEAVTVASDAFTVTRRTQNVTVNGGAAPSTVAVVANSVTTISSSEYLVTFTGTGTHAGGVIDSGVYDLTTLASKVTVGAQTMAANQTTTFFAMFGNIEANNRYNGVTITQPIPQAGYSSGNGLTKAFVDPGSLFQFSDTFGSRATAPAGPPPYNIVFDYNLDGAIDPGDLFAFSDSFGIDWNF